MSPSLPLLHDVSPVVPFYGSVVFLLHTHGRRLLPEVHIYLSSNYEDRLHRISQSQLPIPETNYFQKSNGPISLSPGDQSIGAPTRLPGLIPKEGDPNPTQATMKISLSNHGNVMDLKEILMRKLPWTHL